MPCSAASATASELGAPTATRIGAPATGGLLHELEREAPAHAEHVTGEREPAVEQRPADDLVHRVVAPDVLPDEHELARGREQAGRVQAAGALERRLDELVGEADEESRGTRGPAARVEHGRADGDLLERALAADAARGARVEAARARVARERAGDVDGVGGEVRGRVDGARRVDERLAEQEAQRELLVVARRPHGHRERPAVDADLQRLLDGHGVLAAVVQDEEGVRAAVAHEGGGHAHRVSGRLRPAVV